MKHATTSFGGFVVVGVLCQCPSNTERDSEEDGRLFSSPEIRGLVPGYAIVLGHAEDTDLGMGDERWEVRNWRRLKNHNIINDVWNTKRMGTCLDLNRPNQSQMEAPGDGQREAVKQNFHLIKVCGITLLKADMEVLQALQILDFDCRIPVPGAKSEQDFMPHVTMFQRSLRKVDSESPNSTEQHISTVASERESGTRPRHTRHMLSQHLGQDTVPNGNGHTEWVTRRREWNELYQESANKFSRKVSIGIIVGWDQMVD
ncbi:hypothetical protein K438DRAFT_1782658 [Mycena galopus ATCC 62051]|nr:hypothetical protein K438DRAFT_1782658 [Mycena galopus ATCC 62051]